MLECLVQEIQIRGNTAGGEGYCHGLLSLAENGQNQLVFKMNNQTDKPSYGYPLAHGATSPTEAWDANPAASQSLACMTRLPPFHDFQWTEIVYENTKLA
jgi:hypothetical protein